MSEISIRTRIQKLQQDIDRIEKSIEQKEALLLQGINDELAFLTRSDIRELRSESIIIKNQILNLKKQYNG